MFTSLMHIAFSTDRMEEMLDFYTKTLGGRVKVLTRYKAYLNSDNRPQMQAAARQDPERIFSAYIQLAPGQFLELFPKVEGQLADEASWNSRLGYSHFGLVCEDIQKTKEELAVRGLNPDASLSKGPSGTWQLWYHDPDGNKFEVMQYTPDSYQVVGHID